MFGLELFAKLLKILSSQASPNQIAFGFALGMMVGLTPFWTFHNFLIIFLIIILNVNLGMAIFGFGLFSAVAWLLDPIHHTIGYYVLVELPSLKPFWAALYHYPFIALSQYNNTVVTGSLTLAFILFAPTLLFTKWFVNIYRAKIHARFLKFKIVQTFKASKLYSIYESLSGAGE
jgi:uncharacterized protein (TIGR03546 family)